MKGLNYALIGCGRIAENHIQAVLDNGLVLRAVCDPEPQKMEALLQKFDLERDASILRFQNHQQMLSAVPELSLCAIATPSGLHAQIALDCINEGKNIIIEKPVAMNMKDADAIVRRAAETGVTVSVCHQNRFNTAIQQLRRALEAGRFGTLSHGSIHVRWHRDQQYYDQAAWRGTWEQDGGCLMNQCIHGIDLLRWMLQDEAECVYGVTRQQLHPYLQAEDVGMAVIQFRNHAIATIEGSNNVYPDDLEEVLFISGSTGTVKIGGLCANEVLQWDFQDEDPMDLEMNGLGEQVSNVYGNGHSRLYADVIDAIKTGRAPYVDATAGRNALEFVLAIYKSQLTGQPVHLPLEDFDSRDMDGMFHPSR